jgi:hypothetical protein
LCQQKPPEYNGKEDTAMTLNLNWSISAGHDYKQFPNNTEDNIIVKAQQVEGRTEIGQPFNQKK